MGGCNSHIVTHIDIPKSTRDAVRSLDMTVGTDRIVNKKNLTHYSLVRPA